MSSCRAASTAGNWPTGYRGERPGLKVILMSGYSADRLGKIQPHSHILPKPFSLESLTETVRNCLDADDVGG